MNKIPQFKVWNNATKKFLEEKEGQEILINSKNQVFVNDKIFGYGLNEIKDIVICRFTGSVDKNKNPIYENDIVEVISSQELIYKIEIEFDLVSFGYWLYDDWHHVTDNDTAEIQAVIGNIFENPELLEE